VPRLVRAVLIGVAALYAVYLLGVNVFLSTGLFERVVNRGPETIWIHFERGWSIFPGRIHARGLQIRGRDAQVEWFLQIAKVDFNVSLTGLLHKHFSASHIDADEVSFRLRTRLPSEPTSVDDYAALPAIPGLGPYGVKQPPIYDAGDWDDHYYHLITVDLEDVVARNVREVWVNDLRFAGLARVEGRFFLRPLRVLEVGPATMTVVEGTMGRGPKVIAQGVAGTAGYTLDPLDPRITGGSGMLHHSNIDTDLRLTVVDGRAVIDVPRLALRLNHGIVMAGTRVDAAGVLRDGKDRLVAAIVAEAGPTSLAFRLVGTLDTPRADVTRATVVGELSGLALGDPVHALDAVVTGSGRVTAEPWNVRADTDAKLRIVVWEFVPQTFVLERLHAALTAVRVRAPAFDAALTSVELDGRHVVVRDGDVTLSHGKIAVSGGAGKIGGQSFGLATAVVEASSATRLDLAHPTLRGTDVHVAIAGGELANLSGLRAVIDDFPIDRGRATLSARYDLRASDRSGSGAADLTLSNASVHIGAGRITGDVRARLGVHAYQAATQEVDFSGSQVVFERVAAQGKTNWKGQLVATGALFRLDRSPELDAQIDLRATDASPFLAIIADKIPGILIGLLRMPSFHASANLSLAAGKMDIEHVEATGGDVRIHGDLRFDKDHHQGEFVVKKDTLPVNIKIDKDGAHVTVFKGSTARDR
jgi:hypothetical protein